METKAKILIVEDERITAEEMKRNLEYLGYAVTSIASSGEDAVKKAEENNPDLILMDIKLKGKMDGVQAAKRIRASADIPIIYITALSDKETLEQAKVTEPFGYVHKPVEERELNSSIEMALLRHKMDRRLKESEEKFRNIFENATDGMVYLDTKGRIVDVNESAVRISGGSRKELLGKHFFKIGVFPSRNLPLILKGFKIALRRKRYTLDDLMIKNKKGEEIYLESVTSPLKKNNKIVGLLVVSRDVTKRKRAEKEKEELQKQLIHSEKMAGIGTLTSGIAHEFNNFLQIIKGHAEFANMTRKPQDIQEALDVVISNTERARRVVRDLQAFAKLEVKKKERVDIVDLIESVLSLVSEHLEKHNIEVVRKYKSIPLIKCNRGEMEQVFLHMVTNARDAMLPKGGKLEIDVRRAKREVAIKFSDTGTGIKRENLSKIFEPFYTTKGPVGKSEIPGIGLGLSVSYGIIKRHGGNIVVESQVGRRTTFTISLPLEKEKQERKRKKIKDKKNTTGPQSLDILVVDDEEEICRMMSKWLSLEGHHVAYMVTGDKAVALAKKKYFDLIFLDVVMPGIPALDVLDKLKEASPSSDVFIMTGKLMDNNLFNQCKHKGAVGFLQKPFRLEDIKRILEQM